MSKMSKDRRATRRGSKFVLTPTTRAIRNALAFGLAVAASVPAFAGTCDVSDPSNATCDGVFTGVGISYAIDDLSLVVGGEAATTIDPADGVTGISLYAANGYISLDSAADINTYDATGISVRAFYGDIDIHNAEGASVSSTGYYSNATGIEARTYYGDITIVNEGTVDASVEGYGRAIGISASNFYGDNTIVVGEYGEVSASTNNVYGGTATGIKANSSIGGSAIGNYGSIDASAIAEYGNATSYGVNNRGGYYGLTSVVNEGSISSYASTGDGVAWAWGVRERGQDAALDNSGTIFAEAYAATGYASGTASYVRGDYASTVNSGDITAYATVGGEGQALAYGAMTWGYTSSSVENTGNIAAHGSTGYGTAVAQGTSSHYDHESSVSNSGSILADSYSGTGTASSMGVYNYALDVATVYNSATGEITALGEVDNGYAFGYGAWLDSGYNSTLDNYGSIIAHAQANDGGAFGNYGGVARSIGASVKARYGDAYLDNAEGASISAYSATLGYYGKAYAFGAVVQGSNIAHAANYGDISAEAYTVAGYAISLGDIAYGGFAVNLNYGTISATSTVAGAGYAQAIGQYSFGDVSTLVNEGSVAATADAYQGSATATAALLYGAYAAAYNYHDLDAEAHATVGRAGAYGIASYGFFGSSVYNGIDGTIDANAGVIVGDAMAQGINSASYLYSTYVDNAGHIAANASSGYGNATAVGVVNAAALYGNAMVTNSGDISANASSDAAGDAEAIGVYNYAYLYGSGVDNSGTITATASAAGGNATATGAYLYSLLTGPAIYNAGTIAASATGDGYASATGIGAVFYDGYSVVDNDGGIAAVATSLGGTYGAAEAVGVDIDTLSGKYNLPDVVLANDGSISASASRSGEYGYASAIGVSILAMTAEIYNAGNIEAQATSDGYITGAEAIGVFAFAKYGVTTVNDADILAQAEADHGGHAKAGGLVAGAYYGDAVLVNHGDIAASAIAHFDGYLAAYAYAGGVSLKGDYIVDAYNAGSINAYASADFGSATARGFSGTTKYDTATLSNASEIIAVASAYGGTASAIGSSIDSKYGATTSNDGLIAAYAYADYYGSAKATGSITLGPGAHGYFEGAYGAALYNTGGIHAVASAEGGSAIAIGARVEGAQDAGAYSYNIGQIDALANAQGGNASATGINTWSYYGEVALNNAGDIQAFASAGDYGTAFATGSITRAEGFGPPSYSAGSASLDNAGDIYAVALSGVAGTSVARAAVVIGEQGASAYNAGGSIESYAGGDYAYAYGLVASSAYGDVSVDNHGLIQAVAEAGVGGLATAVYMGSEGSNTLYNSGEIVAAGNGSAHIAVASSSDAYATIENYGSIAGSILTGNRDDSLINHAGATLLLRNDLVDLGAYSYEGNHFDNEGLVLVRGAGNVIDMGQGLYTIVPSLNPLAFVNDGVIDFHDGASDDVLTIVGDFAGSGEINVDVSGLSGQSDLLYVDGSIVDGGVQSVNVWFTGLPSVASSQITVAQVSGNSTAGAFVLGDVHSAVDPGFLSLDFSLVADIDPSNASTDDFAFQVEVAGLSDAGVLATSIAPGAQRLMGSQVGTWRQRMGMIGEFAKGGVSLWARLFQAKGSISPEHEADNFGQGGNFDYEQKNSGMEAGIDFAVAEEFSLGLLLAKAEANQHLRGTGVGSSRIEGDTWGVYGTWISPNGFYLDASWRHMGFTASTASLDADGNAETFNLEGGYAWTLEGGLKLEPQLQYTRTNVYDVDALEFGATELRVEDGTSSVARLGLMLSKQFDASASGWVWTPYGSISAVREFDGDNGYSINGDFSGSSSLGGNSALLEAGFTARSGKLSLSGGFNWQDGGALDGVFGGQLNLRYSW